MDPIFQSLDAEWEALCRQGAARDAIEQWHRSPALRGFDDLDGIVAYLWRRPPPADADAILAALVGISRSDELATRALLQALRPGLKSLVAGYRGLVGDDVASTVVATAWERLRTYPLERRPAKIAANVLLDVRKALLRTLPRELALLPEPQWVDEECVEPGAELLELLADALAASAIDRGEATLIARTRITGLTWAEAGAESGTREATLRQRRWRAEQRLAAHCRSARAEAVAA